MNLGCAGVGNALLTCALTGFIGSEQGHYRVVPLSHRY